jgi:predicted PurR-regulated permease PerM
MTPLRTKLEQNLGWGILLLLFTGCLVVLWPFVTALLWATVLAFSSWPIYRRLLTWLAGRRTLAALLVVLTMMLVVLLPFVIAGLSLAENVSELKTAAQRLLAEHVPRAPEWLERIPVVGHNAAERWQIMAADGEQLLDAARRFVEPVASSLLKAGLKLGGGLLELALSILITFFLLRNGSLVGEQFESAIVRIAGERGHYLLQVAGDTVRGVVYGILGTALVQAMIAGVGFLIAGVPGPALLGLLTFFLSVVPVGPPLVWLPAAFWLFNQGRPGWGIFMLIWGLGVSTVDSFVKPWLISQGSDLPFLLILFGVLGGALAFGFIGVFIGPTLLAVGYRVVNEWAAANRPEMSATGAMSDTAPVQS